MEFEMGAAVLHKEYSMTLGIVVAAVIQISEWIRTTS